MTRHGRALGLLVALCLLAILPFAVRADEPVAGDIGSAQIVMRAEPSELPGGRSLVWFDWSGGDWNQLAARLWLHDCGLQALWLRDRGWVWHAGLPAAFNQAFGSESVDGKPITAGELAELILLGGGALYQSSIPNIEILKNKDKSQQRTDIQRLTTELHELCHIHQSWYMFKEYIDYDYRKYSSHNDHAGGLWYETPMVQEFNYIIGFTQNEDGSWVPPEKKYRYMSVQFGGGRGASTWVGTPKELSAELCAYSILRHIQPNSPYEKYTKDPYITPEIQQWIETYMVLPEPEGATAAGG